MLSINSVYADYARRVSCVGTHTGDENARIIADAFRTNTTIEDVRVMGTLVRRVHRQFVVCQCQQTVLTRYASAQTMSSA